METEKIEVVCDKDCIKCQLRFFDYGNGIYYCTMETNSGSQINKNDTIKIEITRK